MPDVREVETLTVEELRTAVTQLAAWAKRRGHAPSCWGAEGGDVPCSCGLRAALGYEPTTPLPR